METEKDTRKEEEVRGWKGRRVEGIKRKDKRKSKEERNEEERRKETAITLIPPCFILSCGDMHRTKGLFCLSCEPVTSWHSSFSAGGVFWETQHPHPFLCLSLPSLDLIYDVLFSTSSVGKVKYLSENNRTVVCLPTLERERRKTLLSA